MTERFAGRTRRAGVARDGRNPAITHPAATGGKGAGLPAFLARPAVRHLPVSRALLAPASGAHHEREATRAADAALGPGASRAAVTPGTAAETASPFHHAIAREARGAGAGAPLPEGSRAAMESRFGADFSGVRLHTGREAGRVARGIGANAFTIGRDVYLADHAARPGSPTGDRLLAHELAHVVQQGPAGERVQCDLMMSLPTALGGFEIEMSQVTTPFPGLGGHIRFLPDPTGPYSAEIGLIQTANVVDVSGRTGAAGGPVDWARVGTGDEFGRMDLMTTGLDGAPQGTFVDLLTARLPRGDSITPNYLESFRGTTAHAPGRNQFGWLRSPTDVQPAILEDQPGFTIDTDFTFETVAKATDTQAVYGALHWGFSIRSGAVTTEFAHAASAESAEFNEALERFRGYYAHEPVVLYFDTDVDVPRAGEDARLADVPDYMNRYPDVQVEVTGFADERGSVPHNLDLSRRRAQSVATLLLTAGVSAGRIRTIAAGGETDTFSPRGPTTPAGPPHAGMLQANRRVVVSFHRTASTPIVMP
jgi:outer membrane protein OmpA-like peptidoglycan-associated protein